MCTNIVSADLVFGVSIGNVNQAITSLRTYGLTEKEAVDLIAKESDIAINDYNIIPKEAISPELMELLGMQYTSDSLPYVYLFMKDFKIDWELYKAALTTLLDVFHLEDVAAFPEKIRCFLTDLERKARMLQRADCGEHSVSDSEPANPDYVYKILENLKTADISTILSMCGEDNYEDDDDISDDKYE